MTPDSALLDSIIHQIRTYLCQYPQAADTREGIAHYWLAGEYPPDAIELALQRLHAMGELEPIAAGTRQLWRRRRVAG